MRLLQYCNVGNIVGGTAACAWSVTRALPEVEHHVLFRSPPTRVTQIAFRHCRIEHARQLEWTDAVRSADLVLLHNISSREVHWNSGADLPSVPIVQYVHSSARGHAAAHRTACCSQYLRELLGQREWSVLHQGVPLAPIEGRTRATDGFKVGRICTPTARKWPEALIEFYDTLARRHPAVEWEFVGCPEELKDRLAEACGGRVAFHNAEFGARSRLHEWHAMLYHHPDLRETFGRTVAEAMRCGCVPIVDDAGGFCEQLGETDGFLCRTTDDFSDAVAALMSRSEWRKRADRCRERADQFSLRAFRGRLLDVFKSL
ncbi:glycosyltransferase family 4 protein [Rubinisphaera margarita]|uniref:glycosyltransferase family 4 protein n=1 Tax=Rubinisphaera margarita TaxID=2909586 RepID=UPI001EE786C3|nr:glycosyltransferase family 4 protein [Rubinisphaera margarita]MCG6154906.1 glycosyltransferase family 4 protein [Rubinisphaera margarita]